MKCRWREQSGRCLNARDKSHGRDLIFGRGRRPLQRMVESKGSAGRASGLAKTLWTLHDVRRTGATGMAGIGIQPHIIEAVLNHVSGHKGGIAGIYNRAQLRQGKGDALARWDEHVRSIVEQRDQKVVGAEGALYLVITDEYVAALQQTFTDDELAALQWLAWAEAQMLEWIIEAEQLSFPGPPMPPAERLATVLFSMAGDTDPERRQAFAGFGPQSPRKLQELQRRRLASTFLNYHRRIGITHDEFVRMKIRVNKQLPRSEQRGAGGVNHTALIKCLVGAKGVGQSIPP